MMRSPSALVLVVAGVVLAALSAGSWYAWMAWDHTYQVDPRTGLAHGPYEAWQVVGCALTLIVVAVAAGVLVQPWLPLIVMPLAFTIAWSTTAAPDDETGMWGVGAVMILVGSLFGAAVLGTIAMGVRALLRQRQPG